MYQVMLVDDEEIIREGLRRCIDWASLDCRVCATAKNGSEALALMESKMPDILISDIQMPGMLGLDLIQQAQKRYPALECILITGIRDFDYAFEALKFGVADFVLKPTSEPAIRRAVERTIANILEKQVPAGLHSRLQQEIDRNNRLKKTYFLSNLAQIVLDDTSDLEGILSQYQIHMERYVLVSILPDGVTNQSLVKLLETFDKELQTYIEMVFETIPEHIEFHCRNCDFVFAALQEQCSYQDVLKACQKLHSIINSFSDINAQIAVSNVHSSADEFALAVREAENAVKFARYYKDGAVIEYQNIPPIPIQTLAGANGILDTLLDEIGVPAHEQALATLRRLFDYCDQNKLLFSQSREIANLVLSACVKQLFSLGYDGDIGRHIAALQDCLNRCVSLDDMIVCLSDIIELTINAIYEPCKTIEHIVWYIDQNYASDLSLDALASRFHISTSYLSRSFKAEKGINVSLYIQTVRIEKAKQYIRNTSLRAYEIAEKIGISDPIYFSKLFKKHTGCRIKDYKQLSPSD